MKRCAICGKRIRSGELRVYSRWTGNSYCVDDKACFRRAKRKPKKKAAPEGAAPHRSLPG